MKHIIAIAGLVALSACADPGEVYRSYSEAGSLTDNGSFGDANMNNHLAMTSEDNFVINLSNRFANEVPNTINFAFDSAVLDAEAQAILRQQAHWIRQFPEVRFRVYGHTDLVGSAEYNKRLGLRRAQAAVAFLTSQGISRSRLEAVASFGKTQPLVQTSERERRNRRTVTEVSGFVKSNPIIMDGKYAAVVYREYIASAVPASTLLMVTEGSETTTE